MSVDTIIRSKPAPCCRICGAPGKTLYKGLEDRLFHASGKWELKKCPFEGCGLIWLDPMPLEEDIHKAYQNYYTHQQGPPKRMSLKRRIDRFLDNSYLSSRFGYPIVSKRQARLFGFVRRLSPDIRTTLDFKVMYLPAHENGRLLEIGCGSGEMLKIMEDLGWHGEGVDFDAEAVRNATSRGLRVRQGSLAAQHYPDDHFDAITMSHLIEHVPDPLALLSECRRILKPGGRAVVVTPNSDAWGHRVAGASWLNLDPPRHLHLFNRNSLAILAERAGFRIEKTFTTIRNAKNVFVASRAIRLTGNHQWGGRQPWLLRRWGKAMMHAEWFFLKKSPFAGEELVLILRK